MLVVVGSSSCCCSHTHSLTQTLTHTPTHSARAHIQLLANVNPSEPRRCIILRPAPKRRTGSDTRVDFLAPKDYAAGRRLVCLTSSELTIPEPPNQLFYLDSALFFRTMEPPVCARRPRSMQGTSTLPVVYKPVARNCRRPRHNVSVCSHPI